MNDLKHFRQQLETCLPGLTKSQQRIAQYLLANYDQAAFLPGAALARQLDVSEPTLVRFARAVGYPGFAELRHELQEIFRVQVTPAARLQHSLADLSSGRGHILAQVVEMEQQYLAEALQAVDPRDFDRAAEILINAKRLFVRAGGPSAVLADLAQRRFNRFGLITVTITESGRDVAEKLHLMQPADVVLITGFTRLNVELRATVDWARQLGCRSILLTDALAPAFRDKVDVVLAARRGPVSTFHSLTVPMTIMNALILAVAMARPEATVAALDQLQMLRATYDLDDTF